MDSQMTGPVIRYYPPLHYAVVQDRGEFRLVTASDIGSLPVGHDLTDEEIEGIMGLTNRTPETAVVRCRAS
jgi:hypothetical protein